MGKTIAYIRVSTDGQDVKNQRLEIYEYARKRDIEIDDFVEITMSSSKTSKQRRVDEVMQKLEESDTLIVTELSRLGRSTAEVIALVNELIERDIRIIAIKQTLDVSRHQHNMVSKVTITMFSLMAELERDFISVRTREALRAKKSQGVLLGKPKGTIQKSKFDKDLDRIKELLGYGLSARKIANLLGLTNHIALNTYIRKRRLRE
jgi:DNA invertase Pin-like site-specific DNA recombinase